MRALTIFLLATAVLAQAPQTAQPPPSLPPAEAPPTGPVPTARAVSTMSEFMLEVVFPTSNEIFYVGRNEEKTERDWIQLRSNALIMAEAANVLMSDTRAKDKDRWMRDAKLLWDVGDKAYKLAKAKDLEGLKALNDDLYEACQLCHVHYRPGYRRRL